MYSAFMTRLSIIPPSRFNADQQRVFNAITNGKRGSAAELTDSTGGLIGPFNAMLISPQLGECLVSLGETMRFGTSLERKTVELATIVVAAHWKSNFEWWIHSRLAEAAGIEPAAIESICLGNEPEFADIDDVSIYRFAKELLCIGHVCEETYTNAVDAVGEIGLVELVALVGYYCTISFILNAFVVTIPPGFEPKWP
jgi:4-carboxymuconolactone decarboxylase